MGDTEEYLIETADRCNRLARVGRELAASLEAMSNDLMARAVAAGFAVSASSGLILRVWQETQLTKSGT